MLDRYGGSKGPGDAALARATVQARVGGAEEEATRRIQAVRWLVARRMEPAAVEAWRAVAEQLGLGHGELAEAWSGSWSNTFSAGGECSQAG